MSIAKNLINICESIINEDKYLIVDKANDTTISGDTDTEKMVIRSTDNRQISRDEVKRTLDDVQNNLNPDDTEEIATELEDNADNLK